MINNLIIIFFVLVFAGSNQEDDEDENGRVNYIRKNIKKVTYSGYDEKKPE